MECTIAIKQQDNEPKTYGIEIRKANSFWFKPVVEDDVPGNVATALILMAVYKDEELERRMRMDNYVPF